MQREQEGAAPSTVRRRLAALSSLFKHLVRHGAATRNPVVDVERPTGFNVAQGQQLGEAFFNSLTATSKFGAQFANKVFVQCR